MDTTTKQYREQQMMQVCPTPINNHEFFRIQLQSDKGGKTKYMNITPDEFRAIEQILIGGK